MSKILESVKKHRANRVMTEDYPMAHRGEWYSDADYEKTGGKIVHMHPKEYLAKVKPLTIDDASRDNIDDLKNHIRSGRKLDPLKIYSNGKEDGRHRAHAADELGITTVPVVKWNKINENEGGETPSKKFVDAMYTKHHVNPLNPHEFIMRHEKGYAFFDVSSAGGKSDEAHIHYFRTHPQRQGIGADALKELQGHAQEHGVKLHLHVGGNNSHIAPKRVLHKFYSKHGFKKTGHDEMIWHPSSKIDEAAVAKKGHETYGWLNDTTERLYEGWKRDDAWGWLKPNGKYVHNRYGTHADTYAHYSKTKARFYDGRIKQALNKGWVRMNVYHETDPSDSKVSKAYGVLQYKKDKWNDAHAKGYERIKKAIGIHPGTQNDIEHIEEKVANINEVELIKTRSKKLGTKILDKDDDKSPHGDKLYSTKSHDVHLNSKTGRFKDKLKFTAIDKKTKKPSITASMKPQENNKAVEIQTVTSADGNTYKAHHLYRDLLKRKHLNVISSGIQTTGGRKIWQKLQKHKDINIHGYDKYTTSDDPSIDADTKYDSHKIYDGKYTTKIVAHLKEDAPTNCAGSGMIAGIGVGAQGEPGRSAKLMPLVRRRLDVVNRVKKSKKQDDALNEAFHTSYKSSYGHNAGHIVEINKNPTRKELNSQTEYDAVGGFLHHDNLYTFNRMYSLHHEAGEHLKANKDHLPVYISHRGKEAHVEVTDASRHTKWHHNPKTEEYIRNHPQIKKHFKNVSVGYHDENIKGDWSKLNEEEDNITIHRGESTHNRRGGPMGGKFYSIDKEFSRAFTQSGQDHEIKTAQIHHKDVMDASHVYAGDDIEPHIKSAKQQGFSAVKFNEGHNQPHSIYVFNHSRLKTKMNEEEEDKIPIRYRDATPEELHGEVSRYAERKQKMRFRHFTKEQYAPRAKNGVRHVNHSKGVPYAKDGKYYVKHHGKEEELTATAMEHPTFKKPILADFRIKSEYLK